MSCPDVEAYPLIGACGALFVCSVPDFTDGNGRGGESIYGEKFKDGQLTHSHT